MNVTLDNSPIRRIVRILFYALSKKSKGITVADLIVDFDMNYRTAERDIKERLKGIEFIHSSTQIKPGKKWSTSKNQLVQSDEVEHFFFEVPSTVEDSSLPSKRFASLSQALSLSGAASEDPHEREYHYDETGDWQDSSEYPGIGQKIEDLVKAIITLQRVTFRYKGFEILGYPLALSYKWGRFYFHLIPTPDNPKHRRYTYRLDLAENVCFKKNTPNEKKASGILINRLDDLREDVIEKIRLANNPNVNLNRDKELTVEVLFNENIPLERLQKDISNYERVSDNQPRHLVISFSGYMEIKYFLLEWLGAYKLVGSGHWIYDRFRKDIIGQLDNLLT